jgi:hypothetical protein
MSETLQKYPNAIYQWNCDFKSKFGRFSFKNLLVQCKRKKGKIQVNGDIAYCLHEANSQRWSTKKENDISIESESRKHIFELLKII